MVLSQRLEVKQTQKLAMNPQMRQAIALLQLTNGQLETMLKKEMEKNPFLGFERVGQGDSAALARMEARPASLTEHILRQVGTLFADEEERRLATELSGWLDKRGFLRESDEEICVGLKTSSTVLRGVLARLREVEPIGLFARNLPDCFALQLKNRGCYDAAYEVLLANMDGLARPSELAAQCGISEARLKKMLGVLRGLNGNPAGEYEPDDTPAQQPDIYVRQKKLRGKSVWVAALNEATLPQVLVLERDWEEMAKRKLTDEERDYMKSNLTSARWLKQAAQQRAATLLRVAEAIVARRQDFMAEGMGALSPLRLRDIAEQLEIHESTVSRSVAGKLIATPHGVLELKKLFSTALPRTAAKSGAAGRARLAQLIAREGENVLSDAALARRLDAEGFAMARRTVAKYREQMGIAASSLRRRAAKFRG